MSTDLHVSFVSHGAMRFVLVDSPTDAAMASCIHTFKQNSVTDVVRYVKEMYRLSAEPRTHIISRNTVTVCASHLYDVYVQGNGADV
jgi:hypothetical protein